MTDLIIFVVNKETRTTDVMMGAHRVAYINAYGRQVRYSILLPNTGAIRITESVPKARLCVLHVLAEWFANAGPMFGRVVDSLSAQAEAEREAA